MNINLEKLLESRSGLLILLGSLFILFAAIGGIPGQNSPIMETSWRYMLVGVGVILLIIGIVLALRDADKVGYKKQKFDELVKTFKSDKEFRDYKNKKLREAKKGVCDLTYEDFSLTSGDNITFFTSSDREEYIRIIEEISRHVKYREIIIFQGKERRVSKAKRLMKNAGKLYQLAGYPDVSSSAPPRHNFMIIDDELFLKGIAISHPVLVEYYCKFYDELWRSATPIMAGSVENLKLIKIAEEKANITQSS